MFPNNHELVNLSTSAVAPPFPRLGCQDSFAAKKKELPSKEKRTCLVHKRSNCPEESGRLLKGVELAPNHV